MNRGGEASTYETPQVCGIELQSTAKLQTYLYSAAECQALSQAQNFPGYQISMPFRTELESGRKHAGTAKQNTLAAAQDHLHCSQGDAAGEGLQALCKGSSLVLEPPAAKEKSPELLARLARLQRADDERKYNAMVHDITHNERKAEAIREGGLVNFKDQMSYGLHVVVVMAVFYLMGHMAAASLSSKTSVKAAGGLAGLVGAMLMETVLLIIRSSEYTKTKPGEKRRPVQPFAGTRLPNPSANAVPPHMAGATSQGPRPSGSRTTNMSGPAGAAREPKKKR